MRGVQLENDWSHVDLPNGPQNGVIEKIRKRGESVFKGVKRESPQLSKVEEGPHYRLSRGEDLRALTTCNSNKDSVFSSKRWQNHPPLKLSKGWGNNPTKEIISAGKLKVFLPQNKFRVALKVLAFWPGPKNGPDPMAT